MYYRGAAAAVVVFDITHPSSFERAKKWVWELRQNVQVRQAVAGCPLQLLLHLARHGMRWGSCGQALATAGTQGPPHSSQSPPHLICLVLVLFVCRRMPT